MKDVGDTMWHAMSVADVVREVGSDVQHGLPSTEAKSRLHRDGPNTLPSARQRNAILRFLDQLRAPLVVILLLSATVTTLLGGFVDSAVILAVVLLNATIGFVQESKALRELASLSRSMITEATVVRDGVQKRVPSATLVIGDVVLLHAGDRVPADVRVLRGRNLQVNESPLTGESVPVEKHAERIPEHYVLADRACMAYASTSITYGSGAGVVIGVGAQTQIGRISSMAGSVDVLITPLTRMIARLSTMLMWVILALAAVTFLIGVLRGNDAYSMVMASVALAVGAIPEGLPAAVTIILAIGVARLAKQGALIRELPAVETLGSTTVICSDKTGTLTRNQIVMVQAITPSQAYVVDGMGLPPEQSVALGMINDQALLWCARIGALCGTSAVEQRGQDWIAIGDPTEAAMVVFAHQAGLPADELRQQFPQQDVIPFASETRYMATLHSSSLERPFVALKGSVEMVLARCTSMMMQDGTTQPVDADLVLTQMNEASAKGMRVLGLAMKAVDVDCRVLAETLVENDCVFCGLAVLMDPPRADVRNAIASCRAAGISVKMITGDHVATARAIAADLQMQEVKSSEVKAYTGEDLEAMTDEDFTRAAQEGIVFARVSPEQKLRLVTALQAQSQVVAMTGDGVNDAPALRRANIGIAMGKSGTDVAREAADMVLTDDSFVTIVDAVRQGRNVFANIVKFIVWVLPTDVGEGLVIVAAVAFGLDLPIAPVQLLWINMTTAVILGLPMAFESGSADVMSDPPRNPRAPLLSRRHVIRTVIVGVYILVAIFIAYTIELLTSASVAAAQTAATNSIMLIEAFYLLNCRYLDVRSGVRLDRNPLIWVGILCALALQVLFTYAPFMQGVFHTAPVSLQSWAVGLACGAALYVVIEMQRRCSGGGSRR